MRRQGTGHARCTGARRGKDKIPRRVHRAYHARAAGLAAAVCVAAAVPAARGRAETLRGMPLLRRFSAEDYNATPSHWSIATDKEGRLFVGNAEGVLRYDGETWSLIELPGRQMGREVVRRRRPEHLRRQLRHLRLAAHLARRRDGLPGVDDRRRPEGQGAQCRQRLAGRRHRPTACTSAPNACCISSATTASRCAAWPLTPISPDIIPISFYIIIF